MGLFSKKKDKEKEKENPYSNIAAPPAPQAPQVRQAEPGHESRNPPPSYDASNSRSHAGQRSDPYGFNDQRRDEKTPVPPGGYGGGNSYGGNAGYGGGRYGGGSSYGNQQGYGGKSIWEGNATQDANRRAPQNARSYGGLSDEDADQNAMKAGLFGNAAQKPRQDVPNAYGAPKTSAQYPSGTTHGGQDRSALLGAASERYQQKAQSPYGQDFGAPEEEDLSPEAQEERELFQTKSAIYETRKETKNVSSRLKGLAEQTNAQALQTYGNLMGQGDSLQGARNNLHDTKKRIDIAETQVKQVGSIGMFSSGRGGARAQEKLQADIMAQHHDDKNVRDANRQADYGRTVERNELAKQTAGSGRAIPGRQPYRHNPKYNLDESDEEANNDERDIDEDLYYTSEAVKSMKLTANAMNRELDRQNKLIEESGALADRNDERLVRGKNNLAKIHR